MAGTPAPPRAVDDLDMTELCELYHEEEDEEVKMAAQNEILRRGQNEKKNNDPEDKAEKTNDKDHEMVEKTGDKDHEMAEKTNDEDHEMTDNK